MKNISDLNVSQIRLYKPEEIPFADICIAPNLLRIQEMFNFKNAQFDASNGAHIFSEGYLVSTPKAVPIILLSIENRKLTLKILGKSSDADKIHEALWGLLMEINGGAALEDYPLIKTQESACVATLDFDFSQLLSPTLCRLTERTIPKLISGEITQASSIQLRSLSFLVKYEPVPSEIAQYDISLASKALTIEPRAGYPNAERRFYIAAPTDTDTLLKLGREVEQQFLLDDSRSKHGSSASLPPS